MALGGFCSPGLVLPGTDTSVAFMATSSSSRVGNGQIKQSCLEHNLSPRQGWLGGVQGSLTWAGFCSVI